MARLRRSAPLSLEELLDAVQQLSPADLHEFKRRFAAWENANGRWPDDEAVLVQHIKARLPPVEGRRLQRLATKSEQGILTPKELAQYRLLAQWAERLDAKRAAALAELVRRRGQPAQVLIEKIGSEVSADGT